MADRRWQSFGMSALAWGYFLWYIPYSGLTKVLSSGKLFGGVEVSGFELLPATALGALVGMPVFLGLSGWWRHAHRWRLFGFSVPGARTETLVAAFFTALIIATTTLNYTFTGVSILLMLLLMRIGVLVLSPLLDALHRRRVRWYSWTALGLSLAAAVTALADVNSFALTAMAMISLAIYWAGYVGRFEVMSRHAKATDPELNRRFFVEEHLASTPFQVLILLVLAVAARGSVGQELQRGFTTFLATRAALPAFGIGLLYEGLFIFGSLIYLDRREYSYCVPVNRGASLFAVVVSAFGITLLFGEPPPSGWQLAAAALVGMALAVLAYPAWAHRGRTAEPVAATRRLLFVCGGNTCRSPMAVAVARAELAQRLRIPRRDFARFPVQAASAGVAAEVGRPLTAEASVALREIGVPPGRHRARAVTPEMVERADAVFCMTRRRRQDGVPGFGAGHPRSHRQGSGGVPGLSGVDPGGGAAAPRRVGSRSGLDALGGQAIQPLRVVLERSPLRREGVDGRGLVRVPGGHAADDEPVGPEAQEGADRVAVAGDAGLRAAREAAGHQAQHHVLDEKSHFEEGPRRGVGWQVEDHRHRRAVEAEVVAQVLAPARVVVVRDPLGGVDACTGRPCPLLVGRRQLGRPARVVHLHRHVAVEEVAQLARQGLAGAARQHRHAPRLAVAGRRGVGRAAQHLCEDLPRHRAVEKRALAVPRRDDRKEILVHDWPRILQPGTTRHE
jgi:protein-tyrosine-phosphatase